MTKRPWSVTIIGCIYAIAGLVGLAYHVIKPEPFGFEYILLLAIRMLAIVGGLFVLRGEGWARWVCMGWIAYHVILSFGHSSSEVAMHGAILVLTGFCLFNKRASVWFRN